MDAKSRTTIPCVEHDEPGLDVRRRSFLVRSGAILGGAAIASHFDWARDLVARAEAGTLTADERYELAKAENILRTVCLQCNTGCSIKVKLYKGVAVKIDGNPYSPFNMVPSLSMSTPLVDTVTIDAAICPKGQAGLQSAYDPYRLTKVLKRAGTRGENKWVTVGFDQAIREIVEGGRLFAAVPGEQMREVTGLREICALRDPAIAKVMAADVAAITKAKDKKQAVEEFKVKHAANLHYLIDPDHPDFGPKNNQLVYMWGRKKGGRSDFSARFWGDYFGTVNTHGHTTVCQGSLYFTCKALSEQYDNGRFTGGKKFYWQPDFQHAAYIVSVGSNLFEGNYGPPNQSARLTQNLADGTTRLVVVNPRFTKSASKATRYLPVKPGEDGAFFMAMIQWLIVNKKYDATYLACANKAAATAAGEPTWSNAPLLVVIDKAGVPGRFVRAGEIGLAPREPKKDKEGKDVPFEYLVVMQGGQAVAVDPNDDKAPLTGDLEVDTEISGLRVKSAFTVLQESANAKTPAQWASICGIPQADIELTAKELAAAGKRGVVEVHRGVAQHTNGFYNVTAAMTVNLLLGNFDWKGGMISASTYDAVGGKDTQPFPLAKLAPQKTTKFGVSSIRHDVKYEDSTLFAGYPAKRNWWPLSSDIYEEIIPSIGDAYPYLVKALFSYMGAPTYSLPAGHTNIAILADVNKVPLYFCSDIVIGETSMYADYIFPDLSYLERWEMQGSHPNMPAKAQPIRQPVIAPIPDAVTVFGEEMPCSYEAVMLAVAERLGLPGYGKGGFGPGQDFTRPDDLYIRMVANVATDGSPVPEATDEELRLFLQSRQHLPRSVFDPERWQAITGPHWRRVVYVLNRGGRFQDDKDLYKGDVVANQYKSLVNLYQEKTAGTKNAFTGKANPGYATYVPVAGALGSSPAALGLTDGYPLHLITERHITQTKSRTISNYWLLAVRPENAIVLNAADGRKLGLKTNDVVKVVSATNPQGVWDLHNGVLKPMIGKVHLTETIMPGVVSFTLGHGHWAVGSTDVTIDGQVLRGDPKRAAGVHANAAIWVDPYLKNTSMIDPVGGSVSFYDTKVRLVKV
jgi:anaerobic selenocysteine-containing dehydrogenase